MPKPLEVSLPSDREVRVVRSFSAPRKLVWDAHTKPELMQRWMLGPPGWSMPVCEIDLRVGGAYRWRWRSDEDGKEFGFLRRNSQRIVHAVFCLVFLGWLSSIRALFCSGFPGSQRNIRGVFLGSRPNTRADVF
jgi:Activator of Hsp90 ATPase homolog 1-like protein